MSSYDLNTVRSQLMDIFNGKPVASQPVGDSQPEKDVQNMLAYLSQCILEQRHFVGQLSAGELAVEPPSRQNFLVGELKELHSGLKHLTWQASQVAKGDYHQRVDFLGDFSDGFNRMIEQLDEREQSLNNKAVALEQYMTLLSSIVDHLPDWLVVVEDESKEIIYLNASARTELAFMKDSPSP